MLSSESKYKFFCFSSLIFHTIIKQKKGDRKMEEKKNKVTAIILLKVVEEEIEKIIDGEFANENDYTDYAAIDKMLALLTSITEVAEMLRTDVDTK